VHYPRRASKDITYSFETPTFYQNDLAMRNTADRSISPVRVLFILLKMPFTTSMKERERGNSFVLSQTPHETLVNTYIYMLYILVDSITFSSSSAY
jgi:hypothetical protein